MREGACSGWEELRFSFAARREYLRGLRAGRGAVSGRGCREEACGGGST